MATPHKLPSGNWRIQVQRKAPDGTKEKASFTAPTKAEAAELGAAWQRSGKNARQKITVSQAIKKYIDLKEKVLSASTIRAYRHNAKNLYDSINDMQAERLQSADIQKWISSISDRKPKTIRNAYGLLTASLHLFGISTDFKVTFPAKEKPNTFIPDDKDLQAVLAYCKREGQTELWIAVMLARYYSLRRGELCALTSDDLQGNTLWITKDCIPTYDHQWIIKDMPKTADSFRCLTLSEPLLSVLQGIEGKYITCTPDAIGARFYKALRECGIQKFGLHRLRHAFASHAAVMGIPDIYTAKMGGWSPNSPVLKTVYQNVMDTEFAKQMQRINDAIPK